MANYCKGISNKIPCVASASTMGEFDKGQCDVCWSIINNEEPKEIFRLLAQWIGIDEDIIHDLIK